MLLCALTAVGACACPDLSDRRALTLWKKLSDDAKVELVEAFTAEVKQLDTFQSRLITFMRNGLERDPWMWPAAPPPPIFEASEHAPRQPIARKLLPDDSKRAARVRRQMLADLPERALVPRWHYDYATRSIQLLPIENEIERIFQNGLAGYAPYLDFAEARAEMILDDGAEQPVLTAFGHAYSDRGGDVIPGLTLYDVWRSGKQFETPDVETLGIVHVVLGDWRTWQAPVSSSQAAALTTTVEQLFGRARRQRGLRNALARCLLNGNAVLEDGYQGNLDRLHSLWDEAASDPGRLAGGLPDVQAWESWLEALVERCKRDKDYRKAGRTRRGQLIADSEAVRDTLVRLLQEFSRSSRSRRRSSSR